MQNECTAKKPFKTALRTVYDAASLIVIITYDQGDVSYGEAVPTAVITGETLESIDYAICEVIRPILLGASLSEYEQIFLIWTVCSIATQAQRQRLTWPFMMA